MVSFGVTIRIARPFLWSLAGNRIGARFTISVVAPVVSWIDAGGDVRYCVLKDPDLGLLADEQGRIIVFN